MQFSADSVTQCTAAPSRRPFVSIRLFSLRTLAVDCSRFLPPTTLVFTPFFPFPFAPRRLCSHSRCGCSLPRKRSLTFDSFLSSELAPKTGCKEPHTLLNNNRSGRTESGCWVGWQGGREMGAFAFRPALPPPHPPPFVSLFGEPSRLPGAFQAVKKTSAAQKRSA